MGGYHRGEFPGGGGGGMTGVKCPDTIKTLRFGNIKTISQVVAKQAIFPKHFLKNDLHLRQGD